MTLIEERPGQQDVAPQDLEVCVEPSVAVFNGPLARHWVPILSVAWVTIFTLGVNVEPDPTGQEAFPLVGTALALALMGCWATMAMGFVQRRRYGALASAAGAVCLVGMTIGCPVSGHHAAVSGWWLFQLAGSLTLLGLSRLALVRST